jgi:hypothetical protein
MIVEYVGYRIPTEQADACAADYTGAAKILDVSRAAARVEFSSSATTRNSRTGTTPSGGSSS